MKSALSSGVYSMCTTRFCDEAAGPLSEPALLEVFLAILGPTMTNNDCGSSLIIKHMHRVHQELHDSIDFFCGHVQDFQSDHHQIPWDASFFLLRF